MFVENRRIRWKDKSKQSDWDLGKIGLGLNALKNWEQIYHDLLDWGRLFLQLAALLHMQGYQLQHSLNNSTNRNTEKSVKW